MAWQEGTRLNNGRYIIKKQLGTGGFGITYLATDISKNNRNVAIKTLKDELRRSPDFSKLQNDFEEEAQRLKSCSHPHIVKIYDLFFEESFWSAVSLGLIQGSPKLCIVMQYISGENLDSVINNRGALPEAEAIKYIQQVGSALETVHEKGLLHRDIKPQNIMLKNNQSAILIDFGIAREFIEEDITLTHTVMLTPFYAPPEQFIPRAKRGAYTDIHALAATLYVLLVGQIPKDWTFGAKIEPPKSFNPSISDHVNQAILKGMEIKPEDRPQSVQEWLQMLVPKQGVKVSRAPISSNRLPLEEPQPFWTYVQWVFICWVCLSLVVNRLPLWSRESLDLEVISSRAFLLALIAFLTVLFAPITEFKKVFIGWRPIIIALIAASCGSSLASVKPTWDMTSATLISALSGYLIGLLLGVPSAIVGVAKRGLQAYYNRFTTIVILIGTSLAAVGLNWLLFASPFL